MGCKVWDPCANQSLFRRGVRVAQLVTRGPSEPKTAGSSPVTHF